MEIFRVARPGLTEVEVDGTSEGTRVTEPVNISDLQQDNPADIRISNIYTNLDLAA